MEVNFILLFWSKFQIFSRFVSDLILKTLSYFNYLKRHKNQWLRRTRRYVYFQFLVNNAILELKM